MVRETGISFLRLISLLSKTEKQEKLKILKLLLHAFVAARHIGYWEYVNDFSFLMCFDIVSSIYYANENTFKYEESVSQSA